MRARTIAFLLWSGVVGCSDSSPAEPASEPPIQLQPVAPTTAAAPKPVIASWPKAGWSDVTLVDELPVCVFADAEEHAKAKFIDQATHAQQSLRADSSVMMGIFASWCVNEGCDGVPSLQCTVERDGKTLVVHSRYWGYRKDGSSCTDGPCRPVIAGCKTPALERGVYTVKHGEQSFKLRIPSVLRAPCFGAKQRTPPGK